MAVEPKLMTAGELLRLPRGRARHELVRGVLRTRPLAFWDAGEAASEVMHSLAAYTSEQKLGTTVPRVGFRLTRDPDTVRAPSVAFIRRERVPPRGTNPGYFQGAPDLAVEVISGNDLHADVDERVSAWLEHGTRLVFVVNPRTKTVAVHRADGFRTVLGVDDTLDGEGVVPGWQLPVRDIFEDA